jgi:hypothetical protein
MSEPQNFINWERPITWDINQERVFMENLLAQRFNFFLVIFSLVLGGSASANSQSKFILIMICGLVICLLMWAAVYRIYIKVDIVLKMCYEHEEHFLKEIARRTNQRGFKGLIGVNSLVGIWIPLVCILMIVIALILSEFGILKAT